MVKQYEEYYTKTIEFKDFEKFGIYIQLNDKIFLRQIEIEQELLDVGKITANEINELASNGYLIISNEGLILNSWEQLIDCLG